MQKNKKLNSGSQTILGRILLGMLFLSILLMFMLTIGGINCSWTGEQLSLDGFRRRQFQAMRVPILDLQISDSNFIDVSGALESYLRKKKWISPQKIKMTEKDWITVIDRKGLFHWEGDAQYLTKYLEMTNSDGAINMLTWSQNNQELASILWPEIERAARLDQFYLIPDMVHTMLDFSKEHSRKTSGSAAELKRFADSRHDKAKEVFYPFLYEKYSEISKVYQLSQESEKYNQIQKEMKRIAAKKSPLPAPPVYSHVPEEVLSEEEIEALEIKESLKPKF